MLKDGLILNKSNEQSYWLKLSDYCSKMSADQLVYINNSQKVLESRTKMMEAFNLYLFERFKDDFSRIADFRKFCDEYVDTVISTSNEYANEVANAINEKKVLQEKVAELERKLNESNSNRAGLSGGTSTNLSIQESE